MNRTIRIIMGTTAALALLGAVEALLGLALVAQWRLVQEPGPATLPEALTLVIVVIAALLGAWLAATTLAAVLAHLPGRLGDAADRWTRAWAPAVCRRVAAVLVGAVVGGALAPGTALGDGPAGPSTAGPGLTPGFTTTSPHRKRAPDPIPSGLAPATPSTPAPGWTPSRPVQRALPDSGLVTGGRSSHRAADVVVHRGDTLWDIARRHLGPDATDAEVAHAWPAWHEANRAVIGDDPGLILPGQVLRLPTAAALAASSSGAAQ
jgi:hypothetical protein